MKKLFGLFFIHFVLATGLLLSSNSQEIVNPIVLRGHLDQVTYNEALEQLKSIKKDVVYIILDAQTANFKDTLNFVHQAYALKNERQQSLTMYLSENAVGALAILPFLADRVYAEWTVSWGDILLHSKKQYPPNVLLSKIHSIIPQEVNQVDILRKLALTMIEGIQSLQDETLKQSLIEMQVSTSNPLVINAMQAVKLGASEATVSPHEFQNLFSLKTFEQSFHDELRSDFISPHVLDLLKKKINFYKKGPNKVGYIYIGGHRTAINDSTWIYVKKALEYYAKHPPVFIILHLDTPGGAVFPSQEISDALYVLDSQKKIPIVTVVDNWALSAGVMLAYSTPFIAMNSQSLIGAAEPVIMDASGVYKTASEKINSALRTEFGNKAMLYGRNPLIAKAMVDKNIILVKRYGELVALVSEKEIRDSGLNPDEVIVSKGKLLTLGGKEAYSLGLADILVPMDAPIISDLSNPEGRKVALFDVVPFFKDIPNPVLDIFSMDWKGHFFAWMSLPVISSLLFFVLMIGIYVETSTPGFGVPGALALVALFLIVLQASALESITALEGLFLVLGLLLLALEMFVIPGFGITGILGILFCIGAIFGMMLPPIRKINIDWEHFIINEAGKVYLYRLQWLCGSFILGVITIMALTKYYLPSSRLFKRFIHIKEQNKSEGFSSKVVHTYNLSLGSQGSVLSVLKPSGKAIFNGRVVDVVSDGEFIETGVNI